MGLAIIDFKLENDHNASGRQMIAIDPKTHQANTGQFWGPMVKKSGVDYRVMSPVTFYPAKLD